MATEIRRDGMRVIQPKMTQWKLKELERRLFASAGETPNWVLADKARRLLADMGHHLGGEIPSLTGIPVEKVDRAVLRQAAVVSAAGITVRSVGSGMALIACGYFPESGGAARRGLEAVLNARAVLDDPSGEYAIDFLKGRSRSLKKLAGKYGNAEDIAIMSRLAHADVRGLALLNIGPAVGEEEIRETEFTVEPLRDDERASRALYMLAYDAVTACVALAEAFSVVVQIPPWVSGELQRQSIGGDPKAGDDGDG